MYMIVHFRDQKTHYLYYYTAPSLPCKGPDLKNAITVSLGIPFGFFSISPKVVSNRSRITFVYVYIYVFRIRFRKLLTYNFHSATVLRGSERRRFGRNFAPVVGRGFQRNVSQHQLPAVGVHVLHVTKINFSLVI